MTIDLHLRHQLHQLQRINLDILYLEAAQHHSNWAWPLYLPIKKTLHSHLLAHVFTHHATLFGIFDSHGISRVSQAVIQPHKATRQSLIPASSIHPPSLGIPSLLGFYLSLDLND